MNVMTILVLTGILLSSACTTGASSDSVEKADSINQINAKAENNKVTTDEAGFNFLVDAANGGLAEVDFGKIAKEKGLSDRVRNYGKMVEADHADANAKVKELADARKVTLPIETSAANQETMIALSKISGKEFDKAFMDKMVSEHERAITVFMDAADQSNDSGIRTFIANALPVLQIHLDSAKAIQKAIR